MTVLLIFCPCPPHACPPHTAPAARQICISQMPAHPLLEAFAYRRCSSLLLPVDSSPSFKTS